MSRRQRFRHERNILLEERVAEHLERTSSFALDYVRKIEECERRQRFLSSSLGTIDESAFKVLDNYRQMLEAKQNEYGRLNKQTVGRLMSQITPVFTKNAILFNVDIEAFEFNRFAITEIGISIYDPTVQRGALTPSLRNIHIIVQEHLYLRNSVHVKDNKDNFLGGGSMVMDLMSAAQLLQILVEYYFEGVASQYGVSCLLAGHGVSNDFKWLKELGIKFPENLQTFDTQELWVLTQGKGGSSLTRILSYLEIPHSYLHNAGNDAYFSNLLALQLSDPNMRVLHRVDYFDIDSNPDNFEVYTAKESFDPPALPQQAFVDENDVKDMREYDKRGKAFIKTRKLADKLQIYHIKPATKIRDADRALEFIFNKPNF